MCCVPSHSKGNNASTIVKVTKDLAKMDRIDGSSCLIRKNTIQQLKMKGSDRSKKVHFDSIEPNYIDIFKNKDVLLIDDVVTSGNSLDACSEILKKPFDIEEGAKSEICYLENNSMIKFYDKILISLLCIPKVGNKSS